MIKQNNISNDLVDWDATMQNILVAMKDLGITKAKLAEILGINIRTIQHWFNTKSNVHPSIKYFCAICLTINKSPDSIIALDERKVDEIRRTPTISLKLRHKALQ
jgi:transcriptional regulator with XRE-family HTH domain